MGGNIDHFSATSQADATQAQITIRAHRQMMFDDLRGQSPATRSIVLGFALFARLFLFGGWLLHIGFDKSRRRCFLLFQFFDPSKGDTQQFLCLLQCFTQFLVFLPQLHRFFFCHGLSLSERSSLNSFYSASQGLCVLEKRKRQDLQSSLRMSAVITHPSSNRRDPRTTEQAESGIAQSCHDLGSIIGMNGAFVFTHSDIFDIMESVFNGTMPPFERKHALRYGNASRQACDSIAYCLFQDPLGFPASTDLKNLL